MGIAQVIARTLPLTVGDGTPVYRTDPSTGNRYTFEKLTAIAQQTSSTYNMPNMYIGDVPHEYDARA